MDSLPESLRLSFNQLKLYLTTAKDVYKIQAIAGIEIPLLQQMELYIAHMKSNTHIIEIAPAGAHPLPPPILQGQHP